MNWNLEKFPNISAFFEVKKWSTTFWKSRDLVVFGVKCFNCDTKIIMFTKYPAWNTKHVLCPSLRFYVNKLKMTFDKKSVLLEMNIF